MFNRKNVLVTCIIAIIILLNGDMCFVNASFVSNLTWQNLPSGWINNSSNIIGEGNVLSVRSLEKGTDFEYKVDVALNGSGNMSSQGGVLVRASGESYSNSYIIMLHKTSTFQRIEVHKFHDGFGQILGVADKTINWNEVYNIKVKTTGNNLKVYFNNEGSPCINVNDSLHTNGQFGLFRAGTKVTFKNITVDDSSILFKDDFNNGNSSFTVINGTWNVQNNQLQGSSNANQEVITYKDSIVATDFIYEADITLDTNDAAGILAFRGNKNMDNTYCVALDSLSNVVKLYKFPYESISTYNYNFDVGKKYHLKVSAIGNKIKVYLDDNITPVINVVDNNFTSGMFGLIAYNGKSSFDNVIAKVVNSSALPEPKHHWKFENNLNDDKGLANGTASEPIYSTKDVIDGSTGLYMDGKDDTVNFNDVKVEGSFTVSFWVRPSDIHKDWTPILSKFGTSNNNTFWIGNHDIDGKIRFGIYPDGVTERYIDSDLGGLVDNRWIHITCSYDGHYQKIYLNGKLAKQSNDLNSAISNKTGNFAIGHRIKISDSEYKLPYKGSIDEMRYYETALTDAQVNKLYNMHYTSAQDISLLIDQVGFRPTDRKMGVLRSVKRNPNWNPENAVYKIKKKEDDSVVKTGNITYWGQKWGSHWWIGDFNDFDTKGNYYFEVSGDNIPIIRSNYFAIADDLLIQKGIIQSQIDSLKSKLVRVNDLPNSNNPPELEPGIIYKGKSGDYAYTYALDKSIHIYRDCGGANMTELESATITANTLLDILKYHDSILTDQQRTDINALIKITADYLVSIQQTSSDPQKNGRMHHMGMGWDQGEIKTFSWRDMPHAIIALVRSYKVFEDKDSVSATKWLDSAKLAYNCMTYRPYYLLSELSGPDVKYPNWNYNQLMGDLRMFYDKDQNWTMPRNNTISDLRTRDIMPAIWACTQLYSVDKQEKYLDKAEEFTNVIAGRQFTDYNNKIEGTYGNFYEFDNDKTTFVVEMHQYAKWCMGNYDPLRLNGIMELFNYRPNSVNAAKWYNTIKIYAENYVKQFDSLTPFGFTPLRMSRNRGIDFFRPLNHGANSIYGLAAINILEIGNFLNDKEYQDLAGRNINYITGMNPGWPNRRNEQATEWGAFSWAAGIGEVSFGGKIAQHPDRIPPKGSIPNGFTSGNQYPIDPISIPDGPNGIYNHGGGVYNQEDGVMHSLSFLDGAMRIEANYSLKINTSNNKQPVASNIKVVMDGKTYNYTNVTGKCEINDLPIGKSGTVYATYGDIQVSKKIDTLSSGYMEWNVDFASYIDVSVTVPHTISKNNSANCTITITNRGKSATTANVSLSADGVNLATTSFSKTINPNSSESETITLNAGNIIKDYLVCAHVKTDNNEVFKTASGKIN
ncbi:LamG-like jellyroll fold domain-containing protein [Vallitalea sp.]|jgi:hypothetical protein|uniref:LamG-like jellyroll fold domain-containing protein n=1 Tax=Vallitalea sp. TaxID=1882829 RepID=UPI0025F8B8D6|nr:LamG-like jellyroll fold domain-containing protein [Vallitalea sp.]MCT4687223.1 glycoside hydrolase family 9 protein [Vallitalea sp.]